VIAKQIPGAPHETLLVLDATLGQNGVAQARQFHEALGVTGVALTKLDGTARGGVVLAVRKELGLPIRLIGVGESLEDVDDFEPQAFAEALVRG
jgi:fused signal recognition particle receptor